MTEKREKLLQLMEEYTREPVCLAFSGGCLLYTSRCV